MSELKGATRYCAGEAVDPPDRPTVCLPVASAQAGPPRLSPARGQRARTHAHTVQLQPPQELRRPVCPSTAPLGRTGARLRSAHAPHTPGPPDRHSKCLSNESPSGRQGPVPLFCSLRHPGGSAWHYARGPPGSGHSSAGHTTPLSQDVTSETAFRAARPRCSGSHTKPPSCQPATATTGRGAPCHHLFFFFFFGVLSEAPTPSRHLKAVC